LVTVCIATNSLTLRILLLELVGCGHFDCLSYEMDVCFENLFKVLNKNAFDKMALI